jgi:VanZ family protein
MLDLLFKKFGHLTVYATLALLWLRALRAARRAYLVAFLITVLYAVSDEIHQSFVPFRGPSPWDVVLDSLAAGVALLGARHRGWGLGRILDP